jgi:DNA-binding NarL/FixJ family response regulator
MKKPPIRIVIADDHELFRAGLKQLLQTIKDISLVGECSNGKKLVDICLKEKPDVVITDIKMPGMDGIEAAQIIKSKLPGTNILAISFLDNEYTIVKMLEAGAIGYMVKNSSIEEVSEAIYNVSIGKPYYCDTTNALLTKLINESRFDPYTKSSPALFNEKEIEMIQLFCEEKTCQEIADIMHKSIRTVEEWRGKIIAKMGVRNLAGMVIYSMKNGIYELY